jgi:predicted secreted hydrolase
MRSAPWHGFPTPEACTHAGQRYSADFSKGAASGGPSKQNAAPGQKPAAYRRPARMSAPWAGSPCRWGLLLVTLLCLAAATPAADFRQVTAPRAWSWPRDHGRHDGFKLEWWYFTGNVHDSSGRKLGYQLTFFRSAFAPQPTSRPGGWAANDLYFAHAAVSDLSAKKFAFQDLAERGSAGLAGASDQTLDVSLLDWSCKLDGNAIRLKAADRKFAIDLTLTDGTGPVLQGPGGVNPKGPAAGQASYYYSVVRLKTTGTLRIDGNTFIIDGLSWMDHEFSSNALGPHQTGWDWVGLQMDDGSDLMIYRLRSDDGKDDFLSGTLIEPDGKPVYLSAADLTFTGNQPWHSGTSGADYPQRWSVVVRGKPITVQSDMPGQELITTGTTKVDYFEGSATVLDTAGHPIGAGYLEMTGYPAKSEK